MLPRDKRLTKKRDFSKLGTEGRSVFGTYGALRIRQLKKGETKFAFIISTKIFKHAVDRNRTKRRLREIVRLIWNELPPQMHFLFIAKPEAKDADYQALVAEFRHMLEKVPAALLKPAKLSPRAKKIQEKRKAKNAEKPAATSETK